MSHICILVWIIVSRGALAGLTNFSGKYKFRTAKGIAKELGHNILVVESILENLQDQGVLNLLVDKDSKSLWTLTQIGKAFRQA